MSSWSGGYVSDVEYVPGYYPEQSPAYIQLACVLNGFEPPLANPSFSYCELGCGRGSTALTIAAANPLAKVTAIDFNPAQIARARREAQEAGLTNVEFFELSFEELAGRADLAEFDIVTLHGVWSWVSQANRENIITFLKHGVKAGGAVAVSYNAMPGWTSMLPVQKMLQEYSGLITGRSDEKVIDSLHFIESLKDSGAGALDATKAFGLSEFITKNAKEETQAIYLAHEYLNEHWRPLYFSDTSRMLEPAKLDFVASASMLDNFPDLMLTPQQRKIYESYRSSSLGELIKDCFVNRAFRRDIYIRGAQKISDKRRSDLLDSYALALTVPSSMTKFVINSPAGEASLPRELYDAIYGQLKNEPALLSTLKCLRQNMPSSLEIAGLLVGSGQAMPVIWQNGSDHQTAANAYNRNVTRRIVERQSSTATLAVPLTGGGINVNAVEGTIYYLYSNGIKSSELKKHTVELLLNGGEFLVIDGETADTEKARLSLEVAYDWFESNTLPVWRRLSLIA